MKKSIITIFFVATVIVKAHPHVFLETFVELKIEKELLKGINFIVIMDEMNSLIYLNIYDINKDGDLNEAEFKILVNENFEGISGRNSHFHINYNEKAVKIDEFVVKDVFMDNNNLIYKLYIPFEIKINSGDKLNISIYDKEYYYDYFYEKNYFLKSNIENIFKYDLIENEKVSYYMGNLNPIEFEVKF